MRKTGTLLCAALLALLAVGCVASVGSGTSAGTTAPGSSGVTISPAAGYAVLNGPIAFTAVVPGAQSNAVTWAVQESSGGTIDGSGNYTAPGTAGAYHVTATSTADATRTGT